MTHPNIVQPGRPSRLAADDEVNAQLAERFRDYAAFDRFVYLMNGCQTVPAARRSFLWSAWIEAHTWMAAR